MNDKIISLQSRQSFTRRRSRYAPPAAITPIRRSWRIHAHIALMRAKGRVRNSLGNLNDAIFPTNIVDQSALGVATMPWAVFASPLATAVVGTIVTYKSLREACSPDRPSNYGTFWNLLAVLNNHHDA